MTTCRAGTGITPAGGLERAAVDLYWLPLGAGGRFVRLNGRVFEAAAARAARRPACELYHSALEVRVAQARFVIEQAPVRDAHGEQRGVVAEGPVGIRWAGRFRIFRYEIRRWRDGQIADVDEAVASPRRLTDDATRAQPRASQDSRSHPCSARSRASSQEAIDHRTLQAVAETAGRRRPDRLTTERTQL